MSATPILMSGRVLLVIAQQGFRDEELLEPKDVFDVEGYETVIVSRKAGPCTGKLGAMVDAQLSLTEAMIDEETVAVVVVGGPGAEGFAGDQDLKRLLEEAVEKDVVVAAICIAPMIIAGLGILQGKEATVFPTEESLAALKENGVRYVNDDVVVDGKFVTANGPYAATAFGHTVVDVIEGNE